MLRAVGLFREVLNLLKVTGEIETQINLLVAPFGFQAVPPLSSKGVNLLQVITTQDFESLIYKIHRSRLFFRIQSSGKG